ncbi:putative cyclic AMP-responsive element-binding protein 3-like protein 3 [Xylogone sp. PMI_703]|nr:putative cyclic AMP-responsive element-binding protein 3-like protein 3 [Xylogone sp. PMI_703]
MSSSSPSSAMSTSNSQASLLDPLDSLLDFSDYETVSYQSPSMTPSTKQTFSKPVSSTQSVPTTLPSVSQPTLSGPSHQYDLYRQQTGIPQGAVASTLAVNSANTHLNSYNFSDGYLSGLSPSDEFDFGAAPGMTPFNGDMDMETKFEAADPAFYFGERSNSAEFVDPSAIAGSLSSTTPVPSHTSNAQQKQQQQIIAQQRQSSVASQSRPRPRAHPPTDPIVEEKITQLLNSMRQGSVATESIEDSTPAPSNMSNMHRSKKDEEDMDEDERLLASEEGKKLSSKERRQLRNKVSARAFRSRRKEYIGQLEGEIAAKVNENSDLRRQNRLLMEENTRLSDLTRMLLSSPSFSGFLDQLGANPAMLQQSAPQQPQQQQQQVQAPTQQQIRKDPNPYAAQQHMQQQHIGLAIIPEQSVDFSMLDINADGLYSYQPQVFSVIELPETRIDADTLAGKSSDADVVSLETASEEKSTVPVIEHAPIESQREAKSLAPAPIEDPEFDSNPAFALYVDSPDPTASTTAPLEIDTTPLFGIEPEKALARLELVIVSEDNSMDVASSIKVQRLFASLDAITARLENIM